MLIRTSSAMYIGAYLVAIVVANLVMAQFTQSPYFILADMLICFLFIGLDLTTRDVLHEAWRGRGLVWKMGALIGSGSVLSWLLNHNSASIAVASFVAFAAAGSSDAAVYALLGSRARLVRVNGSNLVSAAVDSIVWPTIALGGIQPLITLGEFAAKVLGGGIWSVILFGFGTEPAVAMAEPGA